MYIKTNEKNEIIQYPSDPWSEFPNVPLDFNGGELNGNIYMKVTPANGITLNFDETLEDDNNPIFENGEWKQVYAVVKLTAEQLEQKIAGHLNYIRETRNKVLDATDWTQIPDNSLTQEKRDEFKVFRQALRDMTENYTGFPDSIKFPPMPKVAAKHQAKFEGLMEL